MQRARAVAGGLFLAIHIYMRVLHVHPGLSRFPPQTSAVYAVVRICECVSHAHPLFRTLAHTWVCVSCPGVTALKNHLWWAYRESNHPRFIKRVSSPPDDPRPGPRPPGPPAPPAAPRAEGRDHTNK